MLTLQEVLKATEGRLISGLRSLKIRNVSTDSRKIKKGSLFIAICGEKFDGHDFIADVISKGACAVVVSRKVPVPENVPVVLVKDTTCALGEIARCYRLKFNIPVIVITGSAGKTTTKELIAHVLEAKYNVLKNIKTENNQFGVPQTLLKLNSAHDIAVIELGTNRFGDIPWLSYVAQPTVAVFTNIGESHLEGLKNRAGVFREKFSLVKNFNKRGFIIFNRDDDFLKTIPRAERNHQKISFGIEALGRYRAEKILNQGLSRIEFFIGKQRFLLKTSAYHNVYNALAAVCCGELLKVPHQKIYSRLKNFVFSGGRYEISKLNKLTLINDTYNANPISFKSAIKSLEQIETSGRKILICGDMLELGSQSKTLHEMIGKIVADSDIDIVLTTGHYSKYISSLAESSQRRIKSFHLKSHEDIQKQLEGLNISNDVILVKGSRGMKMDKTVEFIRQTFN